jgi:hypothetical protein
MVASSGAMMRTKSNAYSGGVWKTYALRNCSIGGMTSRLGSPPGKSLGMPVACWLAETLINMMGPSLEMTKGTLLARST